MIVRTRYCRNYLVTKWMTRNRQTVETYFCPAGVRGDFYATDLFHHKIPNWIIGVQERADENEPLNEALYHTHMKIIISVVSDIPSTTVGTNTVFIDFYL